MKNCSIDRENIGLGIFKDIFDQSLRIIEEPLIEKDIIYLQNKFLENGFHTLKTSSLESGRLIINKVLISLNYYNDIAVLSSDLNIKNYYNITKTLLNDFDIHNDQTKLTDFFLDQFYFDFLIVESNQELSSYNWVEKFEQLVLDFNFHKVMPIIILHYEN